MIVLVFLALYRNKEIILTRVSHYYYKVGCVLCCVVFSCESECLCAVVVSVSVSDACRERPIQTHPKPNTNNLLQSFFSLHVSLLHSAPLSLHNHIIIIIISFPFKVTITSTILLCPFRHLSSVSIFTLFNS
ncbi:hypothetical protein RJT34_15747 [Clitoria ternatea]|uniref:Uncharacterized protein n=1 Tax=Clitoria ternatea TaxID=43366 RepID=A0AAN9J7E1_CLITE